MPIREPLLPFSWHRTVYYDRLRPFWIVRDHRLQLRLRRIRTDLAITSLNSELVGSSWQDIALKTASKLGFILIHPTFKKTAGSFSYFCEDFFLLYTPHALCLATMQRSFQFVCLILAFATFVVHPAPLTSVSSTPETSDVPRLQSLERRDDKQPLLVDVLLLEDNHGKHSEVAQI
ncbi:hypothetical protein EV361DRAFT_563578 [Lentinula raphanica]|nr:hypothetical protein EV361DRAFT_563578 [Lentinula raphanica]